MFPVPPHSYSLKGKIIGYEPVDSGSNPAGTVVILALFILPEFQNLG